MKKPYYHLLIVMLCFSSVLQNCTQLSQEFANLEVSNISNINADEQPIDIASQGLSLAYGPFVTASGGLVTFQQEENSWTAKVQETGPLVRAQQLTVGCAGDIAQTLSQLQCQPADYIKSRVHVLSPTQSPTGKGAVYLGKMGLSGGTEEHKVKQDTFSLPPLHQAAQAGNLVVVKYLVEEKRTDVNVLDDFGNTALYWAAGAGQLEVIKYLVEEKGADVNIRDSLYRTVLHVAARKGYLPIVKYFVEEKNTDVNVRDSFDRTVLHWATEQNNLAVIKYLVEEESTDVNARDSFDRTVLHWATEKENLAVIQYLVEKGANVSARDNLERTALHLAAEKGNLAIFQYLVEEQKADVNAYDDDGKTVLHWAVLKGNLAIVQYLIEEQQVNVNARDDDGNTILHLAAQGGNLETIKYLVEEKGADVNVRNNRKETVLHWAASKADVVVVKYLVEENNADVNVQDSIKSTVLHWAASKGNLDIIKYLIEEKNADANVQDKNSTTVLHCAARKGDLSVIRFLLEKSDADVDVPNDQGMTALHYAARKGYLAVVRYLVEEKNADVNARNCRGMTALHWAAKEGYLEIILYLMEEAKGRHNLQIIDDLERSCFEQWENIDPYTRLITFADRLYSGENSEILCQEEANMIINSSLKLKLSYEGGAQRPSKECPHDLITAFRNRFNNRVRREGVPEAMLLAPKKYFKGILLPDSLKTECQAFIELINVGRELYILHASSLVALLEANEEISSTPLSFILCPPRNFKPYDPEDPVQRRTVEFYTQRSPELAKLVDYVEDVNRDFSSAEIDRALCKYLTTYLSKFETHAKIVEAVLADEARKDLFSTQIKSMLVEDDVLLPVGLRVKLASLLETLLTPGTP